MAALDFPASPTDGQVFNNWIYNTASGAWKAKPLTAAKTAVSDSPPASPANGDQWFNTLDGTLYIYVTDIDGSQWVESRAPITADGYTSPNYIINGGFDVWQRGTTVTKNTSSATDFLPDRWRVTGGSSPANQTRVFSRQSAELRGFQYAARALRTAGVTATIATGFLMDLETSVSIPLQGQTATLSFYARAGVNFSAASSVLTSTVYTGTGTDQNLTTGYTGVVTATGANTLTTTWTRFSQIVTIPDNSTQIGIGLTYVPAGTAGTNDYFEITGVQLESGAVASPFRRNANSVQGELAACQRYSYLGPGAAVGKWTSTTAGILFVSFPVTMRVTPTVLHTTNYISSNVGIGNITTTASTLASGSAQGVEMNIVGSGATSGNTAATSGSLAVLFSAEL